MRKTFVLCLAIIMLTSFASCTVDDETLKIADMNSNSSASVISDYSSEDISDDLVSKDNSDTGSNFHEFDEETIIRELKLKFNMFDYINYGRMEHTTEVTADFIYNSISYIYYKVTDTKFKTTEDIKAFILTLYDESLADDKYYFLFGNNDGLYPSYVDIDGSLYIVKDFPGKSPGDDLDMENATVTKNDDGTLIVTIPFIAYEGETDFYTVTLFDNGENWVIIDSVV